MGSAATTLKADVENTTSAAVRWYVLIMMVLVYTLSIADRYVVSQVLEPIRLDLHLSEWGVSNVTTLGLALFYVVFGFPISYLIDRYSRRNIIAISLVVWSAMTTLTGRAIGTWTFLCTRIGVGIGEAGGTPGANSILSDYFPAIRRPMALTIFSLGAPIGAFVAAQVAGQIADHFGWRAVFLCFGVPGIVVALLVYFTVPEPKRGILDHKDDDRSPSFLETMRFLWLQRSAVHVMAGSAVTALWGWGLMFYIPTYMLRRFGLSPGGSGDILGPIHLIGGIGATLFTGWLLVWPKMADPRRIVRLLGAWVGLATIASIAILLTQSLLMVKILCWIFIPSIYFYIGPCFGVLNNLAQPKMRAIFCASTLFVANVGNLIIAPQMVGFLDDFFAATAAGPDAASMRLALLCLAPTGFWATVHYFLAVKNICADQERATGVPVG